MFRRLLAIIGISVGCLTSASAGVYMGPLVSYESIRAGGASYEGFTPRLTLGYSDYIRDSLYLAGEILAGGATINHNNGPSATASLKTSYSYGASIIPGVALDRTIMAYGRAGVLKSRFSTLRKTRSGLMLGLGVQIRLTDTWETRAEYDNTKYQSISGVGSPNADQYSLGLVYKWQ